MKTNTWSLWIAAAALACGAWLSAGCAKPAEQAVGAPQREAGAPPVPGDAAAAREVTLRVSGMT
jgi:hypothetical protein